MAWTSRTLGVALMLAAAARASGQYVPHMDVRARWGILLIPVSSDGCPLERADAPLAQLRAVCADYAAKALSSRRRSDRTAYAKSAGECVRKYDELYIPLLAGKYSRANFEAVSDRTRADGVDADRIECLLAESHNERVNAEIDARQAEWDALEERINQQSARTDAAIAALRTESLPPPDPESTGRRALRALGLVLQGMGQGLAGSGRSTVPDTPQPSAPAASARSGCVSDYECPYGSACVKAPYATAGYCAEKVNAYGTPTYSAPSPGSVMPGARGQCGFDTDCPVGFYCAIEPGSLRGACLKR